MNSYAIFKQRKSNILYFMYLGLGGAAFDPSCHPTIRRVYFSLISYAMVFSSLSGFPCLYEALTIEKVDITFFLSASNGFFVAPAMLMQISSVYLCRKNFRKALELIDNNFYIDWADVKWPEEEAILVKKVNVNFWTAVVLLTIGSSTACYIILRYVAAILADSEDVFRDYHYYTFIIPFTYTKYVNSFSSYTVLYLMQVAVLIIFYSKGTTLIVFLFYLGGTFYNPFVELVYNLKIEFRETKIKPLIGSKCVEYLKNYRKLLRATENIRLYILINYPLNCATVIMYFVPSAFSLLQENQPLFYKLTSASNLISLTLYLFACCYIGKLMDDVNDMMTFAVYDLPWYRFEKRDRKLIHMVLCEIQRTHFKIFALKVYRVSMTAFLRIMNLNYNIITLLRRLGSK